MKYCADTWFFLQLANRHPKALEIWREIKEGKGRLAVSAIVVAETVKQLLRKNLCKDVEALSRALDSSEKITVVGVTKEIAEKGGMYAYSQNMPTVDGVIQATAIMTDHRNLLSDDRHYRSAERQKLIKTVSW